MYWPCGQDPGRKPEGHQRALAREAMSLGEQSSDLQGQLSVSGTPERRRALHDRPRSRLDSTLERQARRLIPECTECEAVWPPADEARWQAWLTDAEPPELVFLLPGLRGVRRRLTNVVVWQPRRALAREFATVSDQGPLLLQEAGAVGSEVVGYELARKFRLGHRRRSSLWLRSRRHFPTLAVETVETVETRL
jgi:hypothetical protein